MFIHHDSCRDANSLRTLIASSYKVVASDLIYFFNFFASKKLKKIAHVVRTSGLIDTKIHARNVCPESPKILEILAPHMSSFWLPEIATFGTFWHFCRFCRNPEILQKSQKSQKIRKIAKIPKIAKKSIFWHFEGYPTWQPKIVSGALSGTFWHFLADLPKSARS